MDQSQQIVKLSDIVPGSNPRKYFDNDELNELALSIKANGVIQPIMLRPIDGNKFTIVAGERRWRASKLAFGDDGEIPAIIRHCDESAAEVYALAENTVRADMSASEEGQAAHRILLRVKGDKEEAAAQLGWTISKLERRVALMRLTANVRVALNERKIQLGHAELIAAIPHEKQDGALAKILEHGYSVAQVKGQLGKLANVLAEAAFDRGECGACQYNSEGQTALFAESIGSGYCTNPTCYQEKTEAHVDAIALQLRDEVPRVEVLKTTSAIATTIVVADGRLGVGEDQAKACGACTNFGCTVSMLPGDVGAIERNICFDESCHTKKVQANLSAKSAVEQAGKAASAAVKAKGGTEAAATVAATEAVKEKEKAVKKAVTHAFSQRLKDYRLSTWRQVAAKVMFASPEMSACVLVALAVTSKSNRVDSTKVGDALKRAGGSSMGHNLGLTAANVLSLDEKGRNMVLATIAPSAMKTCDETDVKAVLKFLNVDLGSYWKLNGEFLDLLTKSEIKVICEEIGLDVAMGEKQFSKAMNAKRTEINKLVLSVESFDYKGVVPKCLSYVDSSSEESSFSADEE